MPSFVQAAGLVNGVGPAVQLATASPFTYGNTAFVALGYTNNGVFSTGVSDSVGNAYSLVKREIGSDVVADIYQADGLISGDVTVTAAFPTSKSGIGMAILEYAPTSGFILALDQSDGAHSNTPVTSFPQGTITTTHAVELIITAGEMNGTVTVPTGYTARYNPASSGNVNVFDRITSATETTTPTPTGSATRYAGLVISLYEAVDTSKLRLTQNPRFVAGRATTPKVRLTQNPRFVVYAYTRCQLDAGNLYKSDTGDVDDSPDMDEDYQAFVKTRTFPPGETIHSLGTVGQEQQPILIARAADGVEIELEVDRDRGAELQTATVDLSPASSESRVIRKFQETQLADMGLAQFKLGDEDANPNLWSLDRLTVRTTKDGDK